MTSLKNPFSPRGKNNLTGANNDKLLNDGPSTWKNTTNAWRRRGEEVSDSNDSDIQEQAKDSVKFSIPYFEKDFIKVKSRKEIVVIIDPGHGIGNINVGASLIKGYEHKIKGTDGKPVKNPNGTDKTDPSDIANLPDYVVADIRSASFNEIGCVATSSTWVVKALYFDVSTDPENETSNKIERVLTYGVSLEMVRILNAIGYTVINTRSDYTNGPDIPGRNRIAKDNNAQYMISLHADGDCNYLTTGAHSIYRPNNDINSQYSKDQKEFGTDIMANYNIVAVQTTSPVNDVAPLKGVLTPDLKTNPALRKTLVELGFGSSPADYNAIDLHKTDVARQLIQGLEINMKKHYLRDTGVFKGYVYKDILYFYIENVPKEAKPEEIIEVNETEIFQEVTF